MIHHLAHARRDQPKQQARKCGLATAALADDGDDPRTLNLERQRKVLQRDDAVMDGIRPSCEMTRCLDAFANVAQLRSLSRATRDSAWTTRMKGAAGRKLAQQRCQARYPLHRALPFQ